MGNNSVPKFIFRLSRFPVYRGSVLGRFYCIIKKNYCIQNWVSSDMLTIEFLLIIKLCSSMMLRPIFGPCPLRSTSSYLLPSLLPSVQTASSHLPLRFPTCLLPPITSSPYFSGDVRIIHPYYVAIPPQAIIL